MPPRGQPAKRKRVSETEEPEEPRRRSSGHVRESSVVSVRQSTRASTAQLEQESPEPTARDGPPASRRQFARRTGMPLPPPQLPATPARARPRASVPAPPAPRVPVPSPRPRSEPKPLPQSRLVVELPSPIRVPSSSQTRRAPSSQNRARAPRSSQGRSGRQASVLSLQSDDWEPSDDDDEKESLIAAAGPGPRTRANRALRPVPQPDPSLFHKYMLPPPVPSSQQESIRDFGNSQRSSNSPPVDSLPPSRPVRMINGEEAYVIGGSDSGEDEDESLGRFSCLDKNCKKTFSSKPAFGRHLREHADKLDPPRAPSGSSTPAATKRKIAQMEKKHAEQLEKLEAKITKLNDEVAELRSQLSQSVSRNAAALQSSSQLEVQLKQKDKAFTDLETQVSERDAKIRTLETKVTAMEEVDAELEAISAPHAPLEGDPPSFELQIKLLHKKVKNKASALRNAESDVEFFRSEYQNASTSAHTEVTRANELEAKVKKLEQQLQVGLKQRDLYSQSIAKEAKAAAERSQQQLNLLMEQARRTDDTVRHKAASFERLTRERENHESELHKERSRGDQLSKRNTELRDQVALLQGRIVGAFDPVEVPDDETDDDLPSAPSARAPKSINPYLVPAFAPDNNSARPSPGLTDTTLAEGGIEMFRCKWNLKEDNMCPEIFHTRDELEAHGLGHIGKLALELN